MESLEQELEEEAVDDFGHEVTTITDSEVSSASRDLEKVIDPEDLELNNPELELKRLRIEELPSELSEISSKEIGSKMEVVTELELKELNLEELEEPKLEENVESEELVIELEELVDNLEELELEELKELEESELEVK